VVYNVSATIHPCYFIFLATYNCYQQIRSNRLLQITICFTHLENNSVSWTCSPSPTWIQSLPKCNYLNGLGDQVFFSFDIQPSYSSAESEWTPIIRYHLVTYCSNGRMREGPIRGYLALSQGNKTYKYRVIPLQHLDYSLGHRVYRPTVAYARSRQ
jgi:hypothetical protein